VRRSAKTSLPSARKMHSTNNQIPIVEGAFVGLVCLVLFWVVCIVSRLRKLMFKLCINHVGVVNLDLLLN
jgi:hypothetical protein